MILSERTKVVKLSPIREIFEMASKVPDLVRLEVGQPDFNTPQHIIDFAKEAMDVGHIGYTSSSGLVGTRKALLKRLNEQYGINFDSENESVITNGASAGLYFVLRTLINPGDEVLRPDPGWAQYDGVTIDCDGVPVLYPLTSESGFKKIDFDALEKLTNEKTKVLILCNPNNPTGSILTEDEIIKAYNFAVKHDLHIIADEAYSDIVYTDEYAPIFSVVNDLDRITTLGSASKNYAMCGWRMGHVIANKEICKHVTVFQSLVNLCPPLITMKAYEAALESSQDSTAAMKEEYNRRRKYFVAELNKIKGFKCYEPEGAFYAFVNISEVMSDDVEFCRKMINEVKVTCIPGSSFGYQGEGYVRFSYAASMDSLKEGIKRMKVAFGEK